MKIKNFLQKNKIFIYKILKILFIPFLMISSALTNTAESKIVLFLVFGIVGLVVHTKKLKEKEKKQFEESKKE